MFQTHRGASGGESWAGVRNSPSVPLWSMSPFTVTLSTMVTSAPAFTRTFWKALAPELNTPMGLAVDDAAGALYVADYLNDRVRRVDLATGIITTVAVIGDEGEFEGPLRMACSAGNLYIATWENWHDDNDNHEIDEGEGVGDDTTSVDAAAPRGSPRCGLPLRPDADLGRRGEHPNCNERLDVKPKRLRDAPCRFKQWPDCLS